VSRRWREVMPRSVDEMKWNTLQDSAGNMAKQHFYSILYLAPVPLLTWGKVEIDRAILIHICGSMQRQNALSLRLLWVCLVARANWE
jgi:hypothetical protein